MKAVLIKDGKGPIENLYIGEIDKPSLKPGEVLVKTKAFGLNRMDISQRDGFYPPPPGASTVLGVEFSGIVDGVGEGVAKWKVGDEVLGLVGGGAYAEYVVAVEGNLLAKPHNLSWAEAASIPENFLTAFQAVILVGELQRGESILIHAGASGVGVAAVQLARLYGAKNIITTASTQEKLDWLLNIPNPATHAVNYKTQNFAEEVKKITEGKGVDLVIDFVGRTHWDKNIDSLGIDGRMVLLAFLSGPVVDKLNLIPILVKRLRIQGSTLRSRSAVYQAELISRFQKEILPEITRCEENGKIRTNIYKVFPWTDIQEAHREMEANANSGKIIAEIA
ncbi:quinone oxidoreductase [Abortiporus biennis]|nr:quinone oxidoreductase [Abortiporus biennis]